MDNNQTTTDQNKNNHRHYYRKKRLIIALIILVIVAFFSFWTGVVASRLREFNCRHYSRGMNLQNYGQLNNGYSSGYLNNSVELSGVVTNIKNNQITVIGNGTTDTINLNSNVMYQNGTKLKVNDSVTIYGQYLNNQLVANTIEINP